MEKIFSQKELIEALLREHPKLRDSDRRLVSNVWAHELNQLGLPYSKALEKFADGSLTSPDSISRCRRKIEEDHPELRGKTWADRQSRGNHLKVEFSKLKQ